MAKRTITRACGHEEEIEIGGPKRSRKRSIGRAQRFRCRSCYFETQRLKAEEWAEARDLPALTGTPKQVVWAMTLRHKALNDVEWRLCELSEERLLSHPTAEEEELFEAWLDRAVEALTGRTEAAWWIDHRSCSADMLLNGV